MHSGRGKKGSTIYLVRHAQSLWNGTRRISGQLNPELSNKGLEQTTWLMRLFDDRPLDRIYSSDLKRAVQTAAVVAHAKGLSVEEKPALRELHLGVLQGRYRDERDPEAFATWQQRAGAIHLFRPEGGETMGDLVARVLPCLAAIMSEATGRSCLIVGHRSTNRVILGALMNWSEDRWWSLRLRSRFVYRIELDSEPRKLTSIRLSANLPYSFINGLEV